MMLKYLMLKREKKISLSTEKGFTLIEVIAVLIILGILTVFVVSRSTNNNNLQTEVDMFKSHLRYAQYIALCGDGTDGSGHIRNWGITTTANSYTFTRVDAGVGVPFSLPGETFNTHTFAQGVTVMAGAGTINFNQWGSPGGNDITITLNQGGQDGISRNIIIKRNTGFIQ